METDTSDTRSVVANYTGGVNLLSQITQPLVTPLKLPLSYIMVVLKKL